MRKASNKKAKIIYVDIDNTICITNGMDYKNSVPMPRRIENINNLYKKGYIIIYWTARGVGRGIDLHKMTLKQLKDWGCLFDKLITDKPVYDLFIDDKNINSEMYFNA